MAPSSKITLTVAGDSTGVRKALGETESAAAHAGEAVSKSSKQAGEALVGLGRESRATRELLRGLGDASMIVGGQEGQMATQAIYAAGALKDLTRGSGELIASLGLVKIATGGIVLAIGAAGAAVAAHIDHTNTMNEVNRTAADTVDTVVGSVQFLTQGIPGLNNVMDAAREKSRGWSDEAHGLGGSLDEVAAKAAAAAAAVHELFLFQAPDQNPGGDAFVTALDMQNINIQAYADQSGETWNNYVDSLPKVASGIRSGGSSIAKAIDAAAQAQKDKLARWQGIADQFSNVAKGIQDSLGPKLVAGIASPLLLAKGTTVLDNLKKQLKDTLHLKSDLAKLSKMGLSNDLLESLTAGGLDSLGSADEILAGGQAGVNAVNHTAGQITAAGGSIAGADAARQFADSLKKPIKVELHVGKGGDDVLDKWLQKALKTKGAKFYGLKAA